LAEKYVSFTSMCLSVCQAWNWLKLHFGLKSPQKDWSRTHLGLKLVSFRVEVASESMKLKLESNNLPSFTVTLLHRTRIHPRSEYGVSKIMAMLSNFLWQCIIYCFDKLDLARVISRAWYLCVTLCGSVSLYIIMQCKRRRESTDLISTLKPTCQRESERERERESVWEREGERERKRTNPQPVPTGSRGQTREIEMKPASGRNEAGFRPKYLQPLPSSSRRFWRILVIKIFGSVDSNSISLSSLDRYCWQQTQSPYVHWIRHALLYLIAMWFDIIRPHFDIETDVPEREREGEI
jgi:hypothetical protein